MNPLEVFKISGYSVTIAICAFLIIASTGLLAPNQSDTSTGTIQTNNLEIYTNPDCTKNCTTLNFGELKPGQVTNQTIYLKNTENTSITLSMNANEWNPTEAGNWLVISWNREGTTLNSKEVISATFTLNVDTSVKGFSNFNFNLAVLSNLTQEIQPTAS